MDNIRYAIVSTGKGQVYPIDYYEDCEDILLDLMKVMMYNLDKNEAEEIARKVNIKFIIQKQIRFN